MKEITQIYHNNSGIAFYWKKENKVVLDKIQLVFKETGFYFSIAELKKFCQLINDSKKANICCEECSLKNSCHKFLLKTPCDAVDLAVSMRELQAIEDLVKGTLFQIEIDEYIYGEGMN